MRVDWTRTVDPRIEPIALAEAKAQCRIERDVVDEDDLVIGYLRASRELCESITGRGFLTQTWKVVTDDWWSHVLRLPMAAPLQSVSSVKYYDTNGTLQTLSSSLYVVDTVSEPGVLSWAPNISLPALYDRRGVVEVTYVVGWTTPEDVPSSIRHAIKLLVAHFYQNREGVVVSVGGTAMLLPMGVDALLGTQSVHWSPCRV